MSDGRKGHDALVDAVFSSLLEPNIWPSLLHIKGQGHRDSKIALTPTALSLSLPILQSLFPLKSLPSKQRAALARPFPNVVIGAGRRMAPYLRHIKKASGDDTLVVQILNPRNNTNPFDILVVPQHDGLTGENVLQTLGSPVHFSSGTLEQTELEFAELVDERRAAVLVCLGGTSKEYNFSMTDAAKLLTKLEAIAFKDNWSVRITASRRTPSDVTILFREAATKYGWQFWAGPQDGQNPYLGWLLYSQAAIITQDSANMLSEAAWFGLPIHIAKLSGQSNKFDTFADALIKANAAKFLDQSLSRWEYSPIREGEKIAAVISEQLINKWPIGTNRR